MLKENLIRSIEEQAWIDRVADPVQDAVRGALDKAPAVADFLHGKGLGHPLHPALVAIPIGAFTTAVIFDGLELAGRGRRYRRAADAATAIGLIGAFAAALPGLADWSLTTGKAKRVGFVHAALNDLVFGAFGASLAARARGRRRAGIALSFAGLGLLGASAWLGGEMTFGLGVGVRREEEARAAPPGEPARIGAEARP